MRPKGIPYRRLIVFALVVLAGAGMTAVALTAKPDAGAGGPSSQAPPPPMPITVEALMPETRNVLVQAQGEVKPLWETTLRTQVDGQVTYLSPHLQSGNRVAAGERLVSLTPSAFVLQAAEVRNRLADAELALLQEEREADQARHNWRRSGMAGSPDSPLVLRTPQLTAARLRVEAARAAVVHADTRLAQTEIRAPYAGMIVARQVSPGTTLFAGDAVATLYSSAAVEVGVGLDAHQWALLPEPVSAARVLLTDPHSQAQWPARIVRQDHHRDPEARLRRLFLQVERPLEQHPPLLPGSFVLVEITGKALPDLLGIPEAALTQAGQVWFVDGAERLTARRLAVRFHADGLAFVPAAADLPTPIRVAVFPNTSFAEGLKVNPRTVAEKRPTGSKES